MSVFYPDTKDLIQSANACRENFDGKAAVVPTSVAFLLDNSYSMREPENAPAYLLVQSAVTELLNIMRTDRVLKNFLDYIYVSFISFNSDTSVCNSFLPLANSGLIAPVLNPSGCTNSGLALQTAYQLMDAHQENLGAPRMKRVIFILTDGKSTDPTVQKAFLDRHKGEKDLAIIPIGLGSLVSLTELAAMSACKDNAFLLMEEVSPHALISLMNVVSKSVYHISSDRSRKEQQFDLGGFVSPNGVGIRLMTGVI